MPIESYVRVFFVVVVFFLCRYDGILPAVYDHVVVHTGCQMARYTVRGSVRTVHVSYVLRACIREGSEKFNELPCRFSFFEISSISACSITARALYGVPFFFFFREKELIGITTCAREGEKMEKITRFQFYGTQIER